MTQDQISTLLIEDNLGDARLIREMLLGRGDGDFQVDVAGTLQEGLLRLEAQRYNVILLDLSLPDSYGIDTLLRTRAHTQNTAIIVMTGLDDQPTGVQAVKKGAQDYLVKGEVDSKLLRRCIRYAIERQNTEAALRHSEQEYRSLIDDVFDTSMVGVLILDSDLMVVWCNEATEIYFGIEREEILGQDKRQLVDSKLKCIFADPEDYAARLLDAYNHSTFTDRFECHVLPGPNRQERWLEHWSQPIRSGMYAGGRIEQYTDITDRKLLEFAEQEQRRFAEALSSTAALLSSTLDLDEVLDRILAHIDRVVPHHSASITLFDDDRIWVARRHGNAPQDNGNGDLIQIEDTPLMRRLVESRMEIIIPDLQAVSQFAEIAHQGNVRAYVGVPIRLQDVVIGFINVFDTQPGMFTRQHAARLMAFAEHAAIAIQNARLFAQSRELAAVEERQRLARELHDSVSQTLFTCSTMSESALRRWKKDPQRAYELMAEVHQQTLTALSEMRVLLLELRPDSLTRVSLKQLFQQYLEPIQNRRRFAFSLDMDDVGPLPPDVQIAFYRVTQEALNNIDKHAHASTVSIKVRDTDDGLYLAIADDGRGFDSAAHDAASTSLGLGFMHERAQAIGASLQIQSQIGHGTRISMHWPRAYHSSN